ncbi:AmmeMemoRadiSam system protein A [Mangrovimicrobium sediminis]|uniref:AmmeMemoRadiSam system protein A n=1 Tax=Mangrovimicrobium sediminis TaxID=2562682 RepID=A0A4Z0M5N4_9GAMM|nr:AmmeMemoRadiSam system protein A [Haliea sp. SAOS-164]TGD74809.1 AmmeMemoRadiSam system protein A [Haliea sp. SAOS-164]
MAHSACTELSAVQRRAALQLARAAITAHLAGAPPPSVPAELQSLQTSGLFVTLEKNGALRGCIGIIENAGSLGEALCEYAVAAACRDPRFPAVSSAELPALEIGVSLLQPPRPMTVASRADLLRQLEPGVDGLVIEEGRHRATFLPQVWEQLPVAEDFLGRLLQKAGLPEDYWSPRLRFSRYRSDSFTEADTPAP